MVTTRSRVCFIYSSVLHSYLDTKMLLQSKMRYGMEILNSEGGRILEEAVLVLVYSGGAEKQQHNSNSPSGIHYQEHELLLCQR